MDTLITANQPAPLFNLSDLDQKIHRLRGYRGQIVLLNFWSAECPWSERVDLDLVPYLIEWGPNVVLFSVASNSNEPHELLKSTAEERGLPIVLKDTHAKVAAAYGALTTPHFFVIDGAGILRYQGAYDDVTFQQRTPTQNYIIPTVQALQAGRQLELHQTDPYGCTIVR